METPFQRILFQSLAKQTTFEFEEEDGIVSADILQIDARFVSLLKWLGGNHIHIRLSGENRENGYAVYKIREIAFGGGTKTFGGGWFFTVYDRTSSGKQCTGRDRGRMRMQKKSAMI